MYSLTCNLAADDTRENHFSGKRKSAEIARSELAPLNILSIGQPLEPQEEIGDIPALATNASGGATLSASAAGNGTAPISPAVPSRGRNAWTSLLSKVSGWSGDKELRASRREERRRSKNVTKEGHRQEFNRQGSTASGLTVSRNRREIGGESGGGATLDISSSGERQRGRSWGKYEGKMVKREKRDEDETQHTRGQGKIDPADKRKARDKRAVQRVLPRSLSFDSSIGGCVPAVNTIFLIIDIVVIANGRTRERRDSHDEEPTIGSGSPTTRVMTEKMKSERAQEIASLEEQVRNGEGMAPNTFAPQDAVFVLKPHFADNQKGSGDFARDRINFELVHRSSYQGTHLHLRVVCAVCVAAAACGTDALIGQHT